MSLYITPIQIPELPQTFEIHVDLNCSGSEVYGMIYNMTAIEGFKLMFRGKKLNPEASLASQGLKDKSKILMMTELKLTTKTLPEDQNHTPKAVLLNMGYNEFAVEKALNSVGSGYGSLQKAIDWIASNQSILENLDNLVDFIPDTHKEKEQSPLHLQYVSMPRTEPQIEEITEILLDESELSQVFTWGNNDCGQLGNGSFQNSNIPQNVDGLKGLSIEQVECGASHTVYLSYNGDIYYSGRYLIPQPFSTENPKASLSHKYGDKNKPAIIETPIKISFSIISAGNYHTLAIDTYSRLWTWGKGSEGQLGHSTFNSECYPRILDKLQGFEIISIGAGATHSMAVCSTGEVFAWGKNNVGQLGVGTFESCNKPSLCLIGVDRNSIYSIEDVDVISMSSVICGSWHTIVYNSSSNQYYKFGSGREFPVLMSVCSNSGVQIKSIECGDGVTYVLSTMSKLFYINEPDPHTSYGCDIDDVLIPEEDIIGREVDYIKAGSTFLLVLTKEGYIYTKGENKRGQLGTADYKDKVRLIQKEFQAVSCLSSRHVKHVSCGNTHSAAVMKGMDLESNLREVYMHRDTADCGLRVRCI